MSQLGFDFNAPDFDHSGFIKRLLAEEKIRYSDVQLAKLLCNDTDDVFYLVLLLLRAEQQQHTCLDLNSLMWENPFQLSVIDESQPLSPFISREQACDKLLHHPAVGEGKPLQCFAHYLYLARLAAYEALLAQRFSALARQPMLLDEVRLSALLDSYFPATNNEIDWQKIACAIAASRRLSVITGGPGTGKTTTVTKLLAILQSLYLAAPLAIKLVAPTGKAAARLTESIKGAKVKLGLAPELAALIPEQAQTLHRLLGVIPHSNKFRHDQGNPLHLDVLIVDEASMVDLALMAKLVNALPENARLILLGDKDQLASVDTGNVLSDLCETLRLGEVPSYSEALREQLKRWCDVNLPAAKTPSPLVIGDCLAFLQKSHRFASNSGIGQLALAVNRNDLNHFDWVWQQNFADLNWYGLDQTQYQALIERAVDAYSHYLLAIQQGASAAQVHALFAHFRLLVAVREGPYGLEELNRKIELALMQRGLIRLTSHIYAGMPVMISQNDYQLKLFNGDIGILLPDEQGQLKAVFMDEGETPRSIYPARLPKYDVAYVMTIHKSQGSEFAHTAILLPPLQRAQIGINRQLLYTGITRAKQRLELVAQPEVLKLAMRKSVARSSGLALRLKV
ncbi:exodeoxyribonuclease V subunit alpha [Pseudoalteromonas fenneropenaei]|uniref:RecBCD enzyme subunit RecD n=1 Tax=Pseudoalteromonas fenneropenaei TaxID=1737459 RepID=A0ABV7CQ49_9GAMM